MRIAFASERGYANAVTLELVTRGYDMIRDAAKPWEAIGLEIDDTFADKLFWHALPRGWVFHVMVRVNEYYDWLLAHFEIPADGTRAAFLPSGIKFAEWSDAHSGHSGLRKVSDDLTSSLCRSFEAAFKKHLAQNTRMQEARIACALERFRHANGAFPEKLDQLVPDFVEALPEDPFDQKPLRYRRNADGGYDVWSIGPDRRDDGGGADLTKEEQQPNIWNWHMPRGASAGQR